MDENTQPNSDTSTSNTIFAQFKQIEQSLDAVKLDVAKNEAGVVAAGVRVRKGIRTTAKLCRSLVKLTLQRDAELRAARPAKPKREKKAKAEAAAPKAA